MIDTRLGTALLAVGLSLGLAGCGSTGPGPGPMGNLLAFGGGEPPPIAPEAPIEVLDCPPVTVADGAAAFRGGSGQVAIAEVARECTGRKDGTVIVKVGVQLRALASQGAGGGRFDTPLSVVIRRGDQVLATRSRRVPLAIPAGQAEASTAVVEEGLVVPPGTGEFEIELALRGGAAAPARRRGRG